jgi:hypothetical protein
MTEEIGRIQTRYFEFSDENDLQLTNDEIQVGSTMIYIVLLATNKLKILDNDKLEELDNFLSFEPILFRPIDEITLEEIFFELTQLRNEIKTFISSSSDTEKIIKNNENLVIGSSISLLLFTNNTTTLQRILNINLSKYRDNIKNSNALFGELLSKISILLIQEPIDTDKLNSLNVKDLRNDIRKLLN